MFVTSSSRYPSIQPSDCTDTLFPHRHPWKRWVLHLHGYPKAWVLVSHCASTKQSCCLAVVQQIPAACSGIQPCVSPDSFLWQDWSCSQEKRSLCCKHPGLLRSLPPCPAVSVHFHCSMVVKCLFPSPATPVLSPSKCLCRCWSPFSLGEAEKGAGDLLRGAGGWDRLQRWWP